MFKRIPSVSVQDLQGKLKQKIEVLDVRTPDEYRSRHI